MYLKLYVIFCCTILIGCAAAVLAKYSTHSDPDDSEIDGSGKNEVSKDLEYSGSGFGPDDEDAITTVDVSNNKNNVDSSVRTVGTTSSKKPSTDLVPSEDVNHGIDVNPIDTTSDKNNNNKDSMNIDSNHVNPTQDTSVIMNPESEDRHTSFFAQPGILAAVIGGAIVGLLCAILVVMFIVYRMRKKDEGSYALGEPKQSPAANTYNRGNNKEFYA